VTTEQLRILGASRGRVIEQRCYSLLRGPRGPPIFSVLKTCLSCRSTEAERAITTVWPAVQDRRDTMCDSRRVEPEDDAGEQNPPSGTLILMRMGPDRRSTNPGMRGDR
jgi:hypothetical protein